MQHKTEALLVGISPKYVAADIRKPAIRMKTETKTIRSAALAFIALLVAFAVDARAVTIDMVTVGNPGNAPDTRYNAHLGSARSATSTRSASTRSRPASTPSFSTPWPRPTPTGSTTRRWAIPVAR